MIPWMEDLRSAIANAVAHGGGCGRIFLKMNGAPDVVIFFSTEIEDFAAIDAMMASDEEGANDA